MPDLEFEGVTQGVLIFYSGLLSCTYMRIPFMVGVAVLNSLPARSGTIEEKNLSDRLYRAWVEPIAC